MKQYYLCSPPCLKIKGDPICLPPFLTIKDRSRVTVTSVPRSSERQSVEELKNQLQLQLEVAGAAELGSWDINRYLLGIYFPVSSNVAMAFSIAWFHERMVYLLFFGNSKEKGRNRLDTFSANGLLSSTGKATTTWEHHS